MLNKLKQSALTALIACFSLGAWAQKATPFKIAGTINGLADGTTLELSIGATHKDEKPIAATTIKQGKFSFNGTTTGMRYFAIGVKDNYGRLGIVLSKGNVTVSATAKLVVNGDTKYYQFLDEKVSGSPEHNDFQKIQSYRDELEKRYNDNNTRYAALDKKMREAHQNQNKAAADSLRNSDENKQRGLDDKNFFKRVEEKTDSVLLANKNTAWGPMLMLVNLNYLTPDSKPIYEAFSPAAKESFYGKLVKAELYPPTLEGKTLPAFSIPNEAKQIFTSQQLLSGHKYTLIDFWASWCGPCRKSIPELKQLYSVYKDKGFNIISISIDKKEADWKKAEKEENLPWPSFLDKQGLSNQFYVKAIPNLFLIDESGKVVSVFMGAAGVSEKVKSLFQ